MWCSFFVTGQSKPMPTYVFLNNTCVTKLNVDLDLRFNYTAAKFHVCISNGCNTIVLVRFCWLSGTVIPRENTHNHWYDCPHCRTCLQNHFLVCWHTQRQRQTVTLKTSTVCPPPTSNTDLWLFDLETGVRVASKMGNLPSKSGHARPSGSQIIRYVRNRRRDRRTDKSNAYGPLLTVGGITIQAIAIAGGIYYLSYFNYHCLLADLPMYRCRCFLLFQTTRQFTCLITTKQLWRLDGWRRWILLRWCCGQFLVVCFYIKYACTFAYDTVVGL